MKIKPKFVFDTNAFVSLALFPGSTIRDAFVLLRKKFDKYLSIEDRLEFVSRIGARYRVINTTLTLSDCRDPKDNKFLELAVSAKAYAIITGDHDLLVLHPYHGIPILQAGDFLETLS